MTITFKSELKLPNPSVGELYTATMTPMKTKPTLSAIGSSFEKASATYSEAALVQRQMREQLLDLLAITLLREYGYQVKDPDLQQENHPRSAAQAAQNHSNQSLNDGMASSLSLHAPVVDFPTYVSQLAVAPLVQLSSFELMMQPLRENPVATFGADFRRRLAAYNLDEPNKRTFVMADLGAGVNWDASAQFWGHDWFRRWLVLTLVKNQQFPHSMPGLAEDIQKLLLWYQAEQKFAQAKIPAVTPELQQWRDIADVRLSNLWYHLGGRWQKAIVYGVDLVAAQAQTISMLSQQAKDLGTANLGTAKSSAPGETSAPTQTSPLTETLAVQTLHSEKLATKFAPRKLEFIPVQSSVTDWLAQAPKLNLAISNAMWQWLDEPAQAYQALAEKLALGGYFALGTFVAGNLAQLAQADLGLLAYATPEQVTTQLTQAGFKVLATCLGEQVLHFDSLAELLAHFKQTGVAPAQAQAPLTKSALAKLQQVCAQQATAAGIPLTWRYMLVIAKRQ